MANHKSAKKRIRQNAKRKLRNRLRKVEMRTKIKQLRATTEKAEAEKLLPEVVKTIDKSAQKNIIHRNTAANMVSKLTKFVAKLN